METTQTILRKAWPVLTAIFLVMTQVSCGSNKAVEPKKIDFVAETMPFPRPEIEPLFTLPGTPRLPEATQRTLDVRRAFFARRFDIPELALGLAHDNLVNRRKGFGSGFIIQSIEDTQLAGIDACSDWLREMPNSYPAHWLCAAIWRGGAWASRGNRLANAVSPAQFEIMNERLANSDRLLRKAISLTPKPVEAMTLLANNLYLEGNKKAAETMLESAEKLMPDYAPIHWTRLNYVQPKWGGSEEQVKAAVERAQNAGVDADNLLEMKDKFLTQLWKLSDPGALNDYLQQAIREHPSEYRLSSLRNHYLDNQNWNEALQAASRLIEAYPGNDADYYWRARIYSELGRIPEAREDYRMAAAMGNDDALSELIQLHVRGGLDQREKSNDEVLLLCRYGASLGSGVGANCLGSLFFQGNSGGIIFRHDTAQAFAWHLLGARGGHFNSQYDLGWLLFTNRGPGVEPETAKRLGIFWLRRAAEQNQEYAEKKLEENHIALSEDVPDSDTSMGSVLVFLYRLFRTLI